MHGQQHRFPRARLVITAKALIVDHHFPHILPRFRIGWNRAIPLHAMLPRIVRRDRKPHVPIKPIQQVAQMSCAASNVVPRIIEFFFLMIHGRLGNQLHQSHGPGSGNDGGIEVRLRLDHRKEQGRMELELEGIALNRCLDLFC